MAAILREELDGAGVARESGKLAALCAAPGPFLSLIIPAYNEGARIAQTLRGVIAYLRAQPYSWEVLVVDDGSADDTLAIARSFARAQGDLPVRIIANPHRGKAHAVRSGVQAARGKLIGFTDADLATPIDTLAAVLPCFADGYHVVIGSREDRGAVRQDEPIHRHLMGRAFNWLVQLVALPGIQDSQCGFKVLRGAVAHELFAASQLYGDDDAPPIGPAVTAFDVEVLFLARRRGYRIASVPVIWQYGTESKVNPLRDSARNFRDVLMVRLNSLLGRYN
jgi:glycosyltransferase involved in cell wall biosynthesis